MFVVSLRLFFSSLLGVRAREGRNREKCTLEVSAWRRSGGGEERRRGEGRIGPWSCIPGRNILFFGLHAGLESKWWISGAFSVCWRGFVLQRAMYGFYAFLPVYWLG